ncbi:MAG TPA: hypothetical protein VGH32_11185 [Pirellulales bacterium]
MTKREFITANRTVTLDADTTVGTLKFDSPISYTLAGERTLTLQAAGAATATINGRPQPRLLSNCRS